MLPPQSAASSRAESLVDAPMLREQRYIERGGDGVGMDDINAAQEQCGFTVREGDVPAVANRTVGNARRTRPRRCIPSPGSSGPMPEILPFMHERGVAVMGSDTGNDVQPSPYERFRQPGPPSRYRRHGFVDTR